MTRSPIAKAIGYARVVMNTVPEIFPCTEVHPLPDGEVRLLGAVRQVTGAMTRVDAGRRRILVDCGVAQGHDHMTFPEAARDAEGLILTHGHLDHIGNVPTLLDGGWDGPIYGTAATLEIARLSLEDSLEMARLSSREIEQLLGRFRQLSRTVPYGQRVELLGSGHLHLTLHEAGHILGSASA